MAGRLHFLLPLALAATLPAHALDLEYRGVIGGTAAGSAYVRVESDGERYRVRGRMRTHGMWDVLAPWNARFVVTGHIAEGGVVPETLVLHEKDRRKDRTIRVADGVLRQLKDGELRPERPAPAGVDLMSALWVDARCAAEQVLNNGRHYYVMTRTAHAVGDDGVERCEYGIVDDDGERSKGRIELALRDDRWVPLKIVIEERVTRGLELVRAGAGPLFEDWEDAPVPAAVLAPAGTDSPPPPPPPPP